MTYWLYRHLDDAGKHLYVGITRCPYNRRCAHKSSSWAPQIARIIESEYPDELTAALVEEALIEVFDPPHNRSRSAVGGALYRHRSALRRAALVERDGPPPLFVDFDEIDCIDDEPLSEEESIIAEDEPLFEEEPV